MKNILVECIDFSLLKPDTYMMLIQKYGLQKFDKAGEMCVWLEATPLYLLVMLLCLRILHKNRGTTQDDLHVFVPGVSQCPMHRIL